MLDAHAVIINQAGLVRSIKRGSDALMAKDAPFWQKAMLREVLNSKQMQQMKDDPSLVRGLTELIRDPEKMMELTGNEELAQSMREIQDPALLTQVMKEAGFD